MHSLFKDPSEEERLGRCSHLKVGIGHKWEIMDMLIQALIEELSVGKIDILDWIVVYMVTNLDVLKFLMIFQKVNPNENPI